MKPKFSKQEIWTAEKRHMRSKRVWLAYAAECRNCALHLMSTGPFWGPQKAGAFFAPKFARAYFGFALENLVKGVLLSGPDNAEYLKDTKVSFGKHGHDLCWLLDKIPHSYPDEDRFWLDAWSISATWYGKYPFPAEMNGCLDLYRPMKSSAALHRRLGDGKRDFTHNDLLHQGIGPYEEEVFDGYFKTLYELEAEKDGT
jgi:hypothetical protein